MQKATTDENEMDDAVRRRIVEFKRALAPRAGVLARALRDVEAVLHGEVDAMRARVDAGECALPEVAFSRLRDGQVSAAERANIRQHGAVIIRGVFSQAQAMRWNDQLGEYIDDNHYYERARDKRDRDRYFSALDAPRPQIFGIYWSRPQIEARQAPEMALAKRFVNGLWNSAGPAGESAPEFDPEHDYTYADRVRRRQPGDGSLGLSPHVDTGSVERWIDPAFQQIYARVFAGDWREHDGWTAAYRTRVREFRGPAVCSMFRSFQGWTALTAQGPGDGTLQLVPSMTAMPYMLLRALQSDVAEDELCGAEPLRALGANAQWHAPVLEGLISIPRVEPGDTVWWHPDVVHAVEHSHVGSGYSNVIYIGASPRCAKNAAYAKSQAAAFVTGESAPDFAPEHYEVDFEGRAMPADLSPLGAEQMALS